jgi:hypothetical protein
MSGSVLKSVRVSEEDFKILHDKNIKIDQEFIHQCVLQLDRDNSNTKETLSVQIANDIPSFIFIDKATNEELYFYLKSNPQASKFIFKKYTSNQSFLKELCDPENPIYLKDVAKNLQDIYQIKEEKDDVERLRNEKGKLDNELTKLREEIKEAEQEYDTVHDNLDEIKKEDEAYNMQRSNIRTDHGLELIQNNFGDVTKFFDAILQRWSKQFNENPTSFGMTVDKNDFNHMDLLSKNIKAMMEQVKTQEFLSPENLDNYHKEMMEKIKEEKENALNQMNAFMLHNPKKLLIKVLDNMDIITQKIEAGEDDGAGGKYISKFNLGMVRGNMDEGMKYLSHLMDMVEAKERRRN